MRLMFHGGKANESITIYNLQAFIHDSGIDNVHLLHAHLRTEVVLALLIRTETDSFLNVISKEGP